MSPAGSIDLLLPSRALGKEAFVNRCPMPRTFGCAAITFQPWRWKGSDSDDTRPVHSSSPRLRNSTGVVRVCGASCADLPSCGLPHDRSNTVHGGGTVAQRPSFVLLQGFFAVSCGPLWRAHRSFAYGCARTILRLCFRRMEAGRDWIMDLGR